MESHKQRIQQVDELQLHNTSALARHFRLPALFSGPHFTTLLIEIDGESMDTYEELGQEKKKGGKKRNVNHRGRSLKNILAGDPLKKKHGTNFL